MEIFPKVQPSPSEAGLIVKNIVYDLEVAKSPWIQYQSDISCSSVHNLMCVFCLLLQVFKMHL